MARRQRTTTIVVSAVFCMVIGAGKSGAIAAAVDPTRQSLQVGKQLPTLAGQFLTGRPARLPQASAGQVTLIAIGFTYASRVPVEAWGGWYPAAFGGRTDVTFFEVPMIGGLAKIGRWFIDRGMRGGTPVELHEHVITVYRGTGDWKARLSYAPDHEDDAYLIVLDRDGVVQWLDHGEFDASRAEELKVLLTSLADSRPVAADPNSSDRRLDR